MSGRKGWHTHKSTNDISAASLQVQFSSQSLFDHLRQIQNDEATLKQFACTLLSILKDNLHNDRYTDSHSGCLLLSIASIQAFLITFPFCRVSIPFVRMLDLILMNGFFEIFAMQEK